MITQASSVGDALFTKTQQRVLGLLYGRPEQSFYLNEIVRLAGVGKGAVNRELDSLSAAGLVTITRQGNQNHYQANAANPIFNELKTIIQKTFGVVDILKAVLMPLLPRIDKAFIYGSIAKGEEHAESDIDVMIVGDDISYSEVIELFASSEQQLGRQINPTLYSRAEFAERKGSRKSFITRVLAQPKLWLVGDEQNQQAS